MFFGLTQDRECVFVLDFEVKGTETTLSTETIAGCQVVAFQNH